MRTSEGATIFTIPLPDDVLAPDDDCPTSPAAMLARPLVSALFTALFSALLTAPVAAMFTASVAALLHVPPAAAATPHRPSPPPPKPTPALKRAFRRSDKLLRA